MKNMPTYQDQLDAMKRWEKYLPPDANPIHWFFLAQLLENQSKLLEDYEQHTYYGIIKDAIGDDADLKQTFLQAMSHAWRASHLSLMVGVQALSAPSDTVSYISTAIPPPSGASNPTLYMKRQELPVRAATRSTRWTFSPPEILDQIACASVNRNHAYETFRKVFDGILLDTSRMVLTTALAVAKEAHRVHYASVAEFPGAVARVTALIHKHSMKGPANNLIGNRESLGWLGWTEEGLPTGGIYKIYRTLYEGIVNVFVDDAFPESTILLWHQGQVPDDSGIIYSPFNYPIVDMSAKPMRRLAVNVRDKITLTHADRFFVIELGLLDRLVKAMD